MTMKWIDSVPLYSTGLIPRRMWIVALLCPSLQSGTCLCELWKQCYAPWWHYISKNLGRPKPSANCYWQWHCARVNRDSCPLTRVDTQGQNWCTEQRNLFHLPKSSALSNHLSWSHTHRETDSHTPTSSAYYSSLCMRVGEDHSSELRFRWTTSHTIIQGENAMRKM